MRRISVDALGVIVSVRLHSVCAFMSVYAFMPVNTFITVYAFVGVGVAFW